MQNNSKAAVVLNAPSLNVKIEENFVICADGGANLTVGICIPDIIVGDFDSINAPFENNEKIVCPKDKDYTDGEKAIEVAVKAGFKNISVYGAIGGRSDHVYANLSLLEFAKTLGATAVIKTEYENIYLIDSFDGKQEFPSKKGQIISVLPYENSITLSDGFGLKYKYDDLTVNRVRSGLGISNVATGDKFGFSVKNGKALLFIQNTL